jgi:hypothetical protein
VHIFHGIFLYKISKLLLACIEEAKKAGLYGDSSAQIKYNIPTTMTIIDSDTHISEPSESSFMGEITRNESEQHVGPFSALPDNPPLDPAYENNVSARDKREPTVDFRIELNRLLQSEGILKATVDKQGNELSRMRRNHAFELRLLQKAFSGITHRDSGLQRETGELAEKLVKTINERDSFQKELFKLESQILLAKQFIINHNPRKTSGRKNRPSHQSVEAVVICPRYIARWSTCKLGHIFLDGDNSDPMEESHQEFDLRDTS